MKNLLITLFLSALFSTHCLAEPNGGISVSYKAQVSRGQYTASASAFDPNFSLKTSGQVGRNCKQGNVSAITIAGINVPFTGGTGSLTLNNKIEREPNGVTITLPNVKFEDTDDKTISIGTSLCQNHLGVNAYQAKYSTSGIWLNTNGFCSDCTYLFSTGYFADGSATSSVAQPSNLVKRDTYQGMSTGIPPERECDEDDNCDWSLEAVFSAKLSIDKSITIKTTQSILHKENEETGETDIKPSPELNMTGTLIFDSKTNLFKGTIKNGRGATGTAAGRYYGPDFDEVEIVYTLGAQMGSMYGGR